jgi:putative ABC transport system permease protein
MFFRMLKQSFVRGRSRKALAALTIALSASLMTALMSISISVGDKMAKELKSYGANINLIPRGEDISIEIGGVEYNPLKGLVFLEEGDLPKVKDIFWRNNILAFAPFLKADANLHNGIKASLIGTYFNRHVAVPDEDDFRTGVISLYPFWKVYGEWPLDEEGSGVLAGAEIAKTVGLKIGDKIAVSVKDRSGKKINKDFIVKGILNSGGSEDKAIVAPLQAVQEMLGLRGMVQSVSVSALTVPEDNLSRRARFDPDSLNAGEYDHWYCTAYVSAISQQIEEALPAASARPIWQVAEGEGAVINKIQLLMLIVTISAFTASALGISSLMTAAIMERSKEIGLMKALGASDREVYSIFLAEAAMVGVIGGIAGLIGGAVLAQAIGRGIFGSGVSLEIIAIPVVIAISILNALAGSIMPSRLITRLYPAEALHGNK